MEITKIYFLMLSCITVYRNRLCYVVLCNVMLCYFTIHHTANNTFSVKTLLSHLAIKDTDLWSGPDEVKHPYLWGYISVQNK